MNGKDKRSADCAGYADYSDHAYSDALGKGEPETLRVSERSARNDPETYAIIGAAMAVHGELG